MGDVAREGIDMLRQLAEALGVAAEMVWPLLVRQAYIDGACAAALIIASLPVLIWTLRNAPERFRDESDLAFVTALLSTVFSVVLVAVNVSRFNNTLSCLLNPELVALEKAADILRGLGR